MVGKSTRAVMLGALAIAGAAGLRKYLARRRHRETAETPLSPATHRVLSRPGYADSGQRPLVDEPPDNEVDESLPLGLA